MKQSLTDQHLNIRTTGDQRGFPDSFHYHPYEATPYPALEKLFAAYPLSSEDCVVDFGCGKGRLGFAVNHYFDASVVGIEMNEKFFKEAVQNRESYIKKFKKDRKDLAFYCSLAEDYNIQPSDNKFYFFNPFSIQIFIAILHNILESFEEAERNIELILYYSSQEYFYYLEDYTPFELIEEIKLKSHNNNPFERFLIYRLIR